MAASGTSQSRSGAGSNVIVKLWSEAGEVAKHVVAAFHKTSGEKQIVETDDQGVAAFNLKPGEYLIKPADHEEFHTHPGETVKAPESGRTETSIQMIAKTPPAAASSGAVEAGAVPASPVPPKAVPTSAGSVTKSSPSPILSITLAIAPGNDAAPLLSGATVAVTPVATATAVPASVASQKGSAQITLTTEGWYKLEVDLTAMPGYAPNYATPYVVYVPPGGKSVVLSYVAQTAPLVLSAVDEKGAKIANCIFRIYSGLSTQGKLVSAVQASRGVLPITNLQPGPYTVACSVPAGSNFVPASLGADQFSTTLDGSPNQLSYEFEFESPKATVSGMVLKQDTGQGIAGIMMQLLPAVGGAPLYTSNPTVNGGGYTFPNVAPGSYRLSLLTDENLVDGMVLIAAGSPTVPISVPLNGNVLASPFFLMEDIHRISGFVLDDKGKKLPGVDVHIESLTGGSRTKITSDVSGYYEWIAPLPGQYRMKLSEEQWDVVTVGQPVVRNLIRSTRNFGTVSGQGGGQTTESIIDLSAYPILTEQVGTTGGTITPAGGAAGGSSLGSTVSQNLRQVLGWKPRDDDPKGFVGALTQSFNLANDEGHVVATWVPRAYAVQTDFNGGITGAQASLLTRTQEAVDRSQPLLDGLYPLRPDPDAEYITAVKAVIKNQYISLVNELGMLGGPRVARVDQIFQLLLGNNFVSAGDNQVVNDPDKVAGEFGNLRKQLGLRMISVHGERGGFANNVQDEENQTNYRVMVDYLTSLRASWSVNSMFFTVGGVGEGQQPFLGTQLVLISRALSVVAETVDEVRSTFDSVFIGPAERQTLQLDLTDEAGSSVSMYIEDVLTWAQTFATQEGPELVQDGGKFALGKDGAFGQISNKLAALAKSALLPQNTSLPAGYNTPRVKRALAELAGRLTDLNALGNQFTAPFGLASRK